PREKRPNYAQIHARPLPLEVYPLPAFIPHNPLSVVRIAIAMISHSLWPPQSHLVIHKSYFSPETQSVHVTDPASIRALWEQGFWGTGSLSRSEPRWLDLEKRKRGIKAMQTSEEYTQQRRRERRQFKLERARLEREAIEEQRRAEGKTAGLAALSSSTETNGSVPVPDEAPAVDDPKETANNLDVKVEEAELENSTDLPNPDTPADIEDQEHLQLTLEEAFFLVYSLGALEVQKDAACMPASTLFRLFCVNSVFPTVSNSLQVATDASSPTDLLLSDPLGATIPPDNTFALRYAAFHHFRSLGWVVRTGVKFGADFLLYNRGPAFSHAEFAVMVLPAYSHPYWNETSQRRGACDKKQKRDWWWLHRVNRVQGLAHKTLMLVYVEVPPPWDLRVPTKESKLDVGSVMRQYKVREFVLGRWTPNRHR
ncbi:hypothetical protein M011DRAFT_379828, partial [Sporormia fimetaria CBS 119925]